MLLKKVVSAHFPPVKLLILLFLGGGTWFLSHCSRETTMNADSLPYRNINDSVGYVGIQQCRSCHENIYQSYIQTGMGQSFDHASKTKSSARFDHHAYVYDSINDFHYKPYWKDDSLMVYEYRTLDGDTVHRRREHIAYIIGSGHHTNSHLVQKNGFLYQAPVTFYTQKGRWDLAPGFEHGNNSRFSRLIGLECMTCHNGYPEFVEGSENKYEKIARGIDCERCHGPGELHMKEKLAGIVVDTATSIDYSIVNPADLSKELQMSLCQRCHLQGVAVLNEGKTFFDFKPSMHLNEVMNVFLPRFPEEKHQFIMASQADRLRMSACYQKSDMTCVTCHNPHKSVRATAESVFISKCQSCHDEGGEACTASAVHRQSKQNNCVSCHMPASESIDIPHVQVHDHYIRKDDLVPIQYLSELEVGNITKYLTLECMTDEAPSDKLMAEGYLSFFEKFNAQSYLLDSAAYYLQLAGWNDMENTAAVIHLHFLQSDYRSLLNHIRMGVPEDLDAWTHYRIGEAHNKVGDYVNAIAQYKKAVMREPLNLEFRNKLGTQYVKLGELERAQREFEELIGLNPDYAAAHSNLGYVHMLSGRYNIALQHISRALQLDPDYEQAFGNRMTILLRSGEIELTKSELETYLKQHPGSEDATRLLEALR